METGRFDYAGALAPETSAYGQAFRASVGGLHGNPTPLVDPYHEREYRGLIGVMLVRSARVTPVVGNAQYGGDLPQKEQPEIHAPDPWELGL